MWDVCVHSIEDRGREGKDDWCRRIQELKGEGSLKLIKGEKHQKIIGFMKKEKKPTYIILTLYIFGPHLLSHVGCPFHFTWQKLDPPCLLLQSLSILFSFLSSLIIILVLTKYFSKTKITKYDFFYINTFLNFKIKRKTLCNIV